MKKLLTAILLLCIAYTMEAQVQQGYVKTLGRPNQPGVPLGGVTIRVKGQLNAVVSGADGRFTLTLDGRHDGDELVLTGVRKQGYELRDRETVGRRMACSSKVPLQIVMVSSAQLAADKRRIETNAYRVAERNYKKRMEELEQQLASQAISAETYRAQLRDLQNSYEKYMALISELADRYARTDYDGLDSIDREINICIENGEMDKADSLIHTVFDPTTVLERNRAAKAEIHQRMEIAQRALDAANRDKEALRRDAEYAARLAANYETLAAEYVLQGDTEKARDCYRKALDIKLILFDEGSEEVARTRQQMDALDGGGQ